MSVKTIGAKSDLNSFIARIFWLLSSRVLSALVVLSIMILYSRGLSYNDYGIFQTTTMYTNIISIILCFGIPSLILSSNTIYLKDFFVQNIKFVVAIYTVLIGGIITSLNFSSNSFVLHHWLLFLSFATVFSGTIITETILIKYRREKLASLINSGYIAVFFAWHYYNKGENYSVTFLFQGLLVLVSLKALISVAVVKKTFRGSKDKTTRISFKHWFFLGINEIVGVLAKWIDKLFLVYLLTPSDFAFFFNGTFEVPLFSLLLSSVSNILAVDISSNINDVKKIASLYRQNFVLLSNIVFPLFLFLFFFNKELFALFFNDRYISSASFFVITILVLPVRINDYTIILQCLNKGNKIFNGAVFDLFLAILLMFILYPLMGAVGVALSVVVSTYFQAVYYLFHSGRVLNIKTSDLIPLRHLILSMLFYGFCFYIFVFLLTTKDVTVRIVGASVFTFMAIMTGVFSCFRGQLKSRIVN